MNERIGFVITCLSHAHSYYADTGRSYLGSANIFPTEQSAWDAIDHIIKTLKDTTPAEHEQTAKSKKMWKVISAHADIPFKGGHYAILHKNVIKGVSELTSIVARHLNQASGTSDNFYYIKEGLRACDEITRKLEPFQ